MEWFTYYHQQTGELYYYVSGKFGGGQDPWTSVYAYGNNGDGDLVYASTNNNGTVNHVTQPNGSALATPIWIGSVRLKNIRDGMQDYEYLYKLNTAGKGSFVNTQITSWITNLYTYEYTGTGLQTARIALGNALHQLTYANTLLPPTNLQGTVQ